MNQIIAGDEEATNSHIQTFHNLTFLFVLSNYYLYLQNKIVTP